mmetsp:Transcript_693/g.1555  ORF Transcript_693/g.1555 Transcript_693/m.1555 type:complete len:93 (+) Transcript_693:613-891(+)
MRGGRKEGRKFRAEEISRQDPPESGRMNASAASVGRMKDRPPSLEQQEKERNKVPSCPCSPNSFTWLLYVLLSPLCPPSFFGFQSRLTRHCA